MGPMIEARTLENYMMAKVCVQVSNQKKSMEINHINHYLLRASSNMPHGAVIP